MLKSFVGSTQGEHHERHPRPLENPTALLNYCHALRTHTAKGTLIPTLSGAETMADKFRIRRLRRACKARSRFGWSASAQHRAFKGRTGSIHEKLTASRKQFAYRSSLPALTLSAVWNVGGLTAYQPPIQRE